MDALTEKKIEPCGLSFETQTGDTLLVKLQGSWTIDQQLPSAKEVARQVESDAAINHIVFDTVRLSDWDSGLLSFLTKIISDSSA